ncbi:serine hydrolase domain-containing protein [Paenibacillus lupini]|uniref:serine hydrolase domain-containing protein n=1 Tax=Paenibacillus lupini TaxID=1450204 RepID=UPI001420F8E7|nr:serine hydrolase domain-containing protein [Paenibacillus lupini]NIK22191.1 CubicO group peptidase (beta-lactamase class C family) [Paenibacillus lupini]
MLSVNEKLEQYISSYMELWDVFGVVQVIKRGEVLFEQSYGYANLEWGITNDIHTCFALASISKQFTAFATMILYDKGLIDLDRSAQLYLPAELQIDESITVHHLLSHTSGLYNFYNFENDFFAAYNKLEYSRHDYYEQYISKQPVKSAGTAFDYNNSNYNLLAWIIEHVSGEKFDDFIHNHIFAPLEMRNSVVDDSSKLIKNRASNYTKDFSFTVKIPYHNEKFSIGAGAIVSNCEDLLKWYNCLRDRKLLSSNTYTRFFQENSSHYCYGLEHHHIYGTDRYSHGGDHLGVATYMQHYYDEDICIIILSNNEESNQYRLGNAISDILHQVEVEAPAKHKEIPISENMLKPYCGTYLKDKIQIELINQKLYFTRFAGNHHIEIYPVGEGLFARRYSDQIHPYRIAKNDEGKMTFFGYRKESVTES